MAIKHDALIPYLEIGRICFNAWSPEVVGIPDTIDFTIALCDKGYANEIYNQRHNLSGLIENIQKNPLEKIFGLEKDLSESEIGEINEKKPELLDYLQNLDKHYGWPNAKL